MPIGYYNYTHDEGTNETTNKEKRNALLPTDLRKNDLHLPEHHRSKRPAEPGRGKDRDSVQQLRQTGQGSPSKEGLVFLTRQQTQGD